MKRLALNVPFDGEKFAARYGLSAIRGEFFVDGEGQLCFPDHLPDNPVIEAPSPKPPISERLDGVRTLPELIALLKTVLK